MQCRTKDLTAAEVAWTSVDLGGPWCWTLVDLGVSLSQGSDPETFGEGQQFPAESAPEICCVGCGFLSL